MRIGGSKYEQTFKSNLKLTGNMGQGVRKKISHHPNDSGPVKVGRENRVGKM